MYNNLKSKGRQNIKPHMRILTSKPYITRSEESMALKVLRSQWLVQGRYVDEFQNLFSKFTGAKFARALTSGTTALHLALKAQGIGRGDRVIVPSFTYVATANAVEHTGAEVLFCDIDLKTYNIDVKAAEQLLVKNKRHNIKVILPVHLFGLCADMFSVMRLAKKYHVNVVEDAACGLGSYAGGKHAGTFGDIGCFSFHPRKVITTGEGGMAVTDKKHLAALLSSLRNHGLKETKPEAHAGLPDCIMPGYNYRMTNLQGALGIAQMKKLKDILRHRLNIARNYDRALKDVRGLVTPFIPPDCIHSFQSYICLCTFGKDPNSLKPQTAEKLHALRNRVILKLNQKGISACQGTYAVHTQNYYREKYGLKKFDVPNAYVADRLTLSLPLYPQMTAGEFEYVIENVQKAFRSV